MGRTPAPPVPVEERLRSVRITMIFQAVLGIAGGGFLLYLLGLSEANRDDTAGYGSLRALSVVSMVLAALVLVCAVQLLRRLPWVRVTTLVLESITVLSGLVGLVSSLSSGSPGPMTIVSVALGAAVIVPLRRRDVREWFAWDDGADQSRQSTGGGAGVPTR